MWLYFLFILHLFINQFIITQYKIRIFIIIHSQMINIFNCLPKAFPFIQHYQITPLLTPKNTINFMSTTKFAGFTDKVYQKLTLNRFQNQNFTLYIDTVSTIQQLFRQLNKLFPNSKFIATNQFNNKIGQQATDAQLQLSDSLKSQETLDLLLHSNLMVYELNPSNNTYQISLGLQVKEYNLTNNRNLPERFASQILQLQDTWRTDRTIDYALNKIQQYDEKTHKQYLQQQKLLQQQTSQVYQNYLSIFQFYNKGELMTGKTRGMMANVIAMMTFNWVILFAITYGKYGWNMGEPISYLTGLGVDLLAMMGIFSLNDQLYKISKEDWNQIALRMNMQSLLKTRQFLIAYTKRQF